jgi:hypothetical protein
MYVDVFKQKFWKQFFYFYGIDSDCNAFGNDIKLAF